MSNIEDTESTTSAEDRLYNLLPTIYRMRDAEQGWPLRALLSVIAEQVDVVEADIAQLYENWFIETCQEWVVPYIGDLINYRQIHEAGEPGSWGTEEGRARNRILIPRREIANTLRYRRRKGTLSLLEELAASVAGWPARAVEFYHLLNGNQAVNHVHVGRGRTVNLREMADLARIDSPFDRLAHSVEVRRTDSQNTQGRYNIPSLGLFVWRLKSYSITRSQAYHRDEKNDLYLYNFSALRNDTALFTDPLPETKSAHIAGELNLPVPITRENLEKHKTDYCGAGKSLYIWITLSHRGGSGKAGQVAMQGVPVDRIVVADLSNWHYKPPTNHIALDPELGRIIYAAHSSGSVQGLWVDYHYGFSAEIGGGEYDRPILQPLDYTSSSVAFSIHDLLDPRALVNRLLDGSKISKYLSAGFSPHTKQLLGKYDGTGPPSEDLQKSLINDLNRELADSNLYDKNLFDGIILPSEIGSLIASDPSGPDLMHLNRLLLEATYAEAINVLYKIYRVNSSEGKLRRINDALEQWRQDRPRHAVIEIANSGVYSEQITVDLGTYQSLHLRAASGARPVIRLLDWYTDLPDSLTIRGDQGSCFVLDGILVSGRPMQVEGELDEVTVRHSTLVPGWGLHLDCEPHRPTAVSLELIHTSARINIDHSMIGTIQVTEDEARTDPIEITIKDSVLDATGSDLDALSGGMYPTAHAALLILRSTVFGRIDTHVIERAENSIFNGLVRVARRQRGCMRFCYVAPGSRTPRRYHCQPDYTFPGLREDEKQQTEMRVRPRFNSVRYGTPTYCQLSRSCADEITRGADDESEMGVFHDLFQPQRETNLRTRLDEYTPAGTDAGIIFAS
jgi:hypothetical protein